MKRLITACAFLCATTLPYASWAAGATEADVSPAPQPSGFVYTESYRECAALAAKNPQQAITNSNAALAAQDSIASRHCRAMALYAMGRYDEATRDLLTVERMVPPSDLALLNYITRQTARALNLSKKPDAALQHLQEHLNFLRVSGANSSLRSKLAAETLLERALLRESYGQYTQAVQELDHAISLSPTNEELLYTRARVFIALSDMALARQDLTAILTSNPDHTLARELLARAQ